ncbi:hypothetical protein HDE_09833 [Halotydeus destructor]|nr:hypothetical protein HDE_09833 [Halotydeus destructor]
MKLTLLTLVMVISLISVLPVQSENCTDDQTPVPALLNAGLVVGNDQESQLKISAAATEGATDTPKKLGILGALRGIPNNEVDLADPSDAHNSDQCTSGAIGKLN